MKKSVKKNLLAACLLLMLGLLTWTLMGCGNTGEEESSVDMSEAGGGNTITVLNYGEYIDTSVLRDFEKETGIKVLYEEATTPEEMYSKYTSSTIPVLGDSSEAHLREISPLAFNTQLWS